MSHCTHRPGTGPWLPAVTGRLLGGARRPGPAAHLRRLRVPGRMLCRPCAVLLAAPGSPRPPVPLGLSADGRRRCLPRPVRPAVNAFKERGLAELAGPLGAALALAVAAVVARRRAPGPVLLVPVPSSGGRAARPRSGPRAGADRPGGGRARGGGAAGGEAPLLAAAAGCATRPGCRAAQRRANLAGSFVRTARPPGGRCWSWSTTS